jgi:hypothetical protein
MILIAGLTMASSRAQDLSGGGRALDGKTVSLRLMLGIGDARPENWNGEVTLDRGEVVGIEGWRFREGDRVEGTRGWKAQTRRVRHKPSVAESAEAARLRPDRVGPSVVPTGVVVTVAAPADTVLTVRTEQGSFRVTLADLSAGAARRYLEGKVEAQRVPEAIALDDGPAQVDFPAAAADAQGTVWIAYVDHAPHGPEVFEALTQRPRDFSEYVPRSGGDQIRLLRFRGGNAGAPIDVTGPDRDVWRPAVGIDAAGRVVVAWSENQDGNWDLFSRRYDPGAQSWSATTRLTNAPGTEMGVVLAAAPGGGGPVWMAWQGWVNGQADIFAAPLDSPERAVNLSATAANEWAPAIVVDASGGVHVAYDTYQAGNYDVMLRSLAADGAPGRTVSVAASDRFEVRPSLAVDSRGRIWVAYEERTAHWGKDANDLVNGRGSTLYRTSAVRVRCLDGGRLLDAPDPLAQAPAPVRAMNSFPRLAADRSGRIWLAFRHREEVVWGDNVVLVLGGVWLEYATSLAGAAWDIPQVLPRSDGLLDNRPALAVPSDGPVLIVYGGDGRLRREVESTPELARRYWTHSGTPAGVSNHDLQIAALRSGEPAAPVDPVAERPATSTPGASGSAVHAGEKDDVARMRAHQIRAGGKSYRLLRGEFHRHTELSQDGGNDGALEDMWRYAIDAAGLDWIGNGDHDNGGSKEYTWWLVQKTTELYHVPRVFTPLFTYERSVAYPGGHRNVMFPYRGVRTLPRLVDAKGVRTDVAGKDEDAAMLYAYLHELGGVCAAHTTGTGGGTDWRANDREVEPFVEIFQGFRNSYEHVGAPRAPTGAALKAKGMIWNALALRYRLGFEASSDHVSTHTSYAVVLAEEHSRQAIFEAFQKRHCYAATDNILLDVRSGDHLMGDEFATEGPVTLQVSVHGTAPIQRIDIIKDSVYAYSTEPHTVAASFTWTDEAEPKPGLSWYYVRAMQEDGELAWGSPMWVTRRGAEPR